MIRLKRAAEWADLLRAYKIVVDGHLVGTIRRGREVTLDLAPGPHLMWLQIDWSGSNGVSFVSDGSMLELECGSNYAGWKARHALRAVLNPEASHLWLRFKYAPPPGASVLSEVESIVLRGL